MTGNYQHTSAPDDWRRRPRKRKVYPRNVHFSLRLTASEYAAVSQAADNAELTVAEWLRSTIREKLPIVHVPVAQP